MNKTAEQVWEDIYRAAKPTTSGEPGMMLKRFTEKLPPGHALELGCGKGDDAIWLACNGWTVTATDISATALSYAAENARRAGVEERIIFEQHDLSRTLPRGKFDLVTASFFHSPVELPRAEVFRRAAAAVVSGGHLLLVEHASRAPWSWAASDTQYPTAEETLTACNLQLEAWERLHVAAEERLANGPDQQTAMVVDNVIFLRRL